MMEKRAAKLEALQFAYDLCQSSVPRLQAAMLVAHKDREDRKLIELEYRQWLTSLKSKAVQLDKELAEKPAVG